MCHRDIHDKKVVPMSDYFWCVKKFAHLLLSSSLGVYLKACFMSRRYGVDTFADPDIHAARVMYDNVFSMYLIDGCGWAMTSNLLHSRRNGRWMVK